MKKITTTYIKNNLPKRSRNSNKTDSGRVLIVGGGKGLYGAGLLASLSATRSGAGYTYLMSDLANFPWLEYPDIIVHPLKLSELNKHLKSIIAIGPGLGITKNKSQYLKKLLREQFNHVVVDADALTLLSQMKIKKLPPTWILTPHEGELARLLKITSTKVKNNRIECLKKAQNKYGCIIVLKGAETLVSDGHRVYAINSGTLALAKAGTGDVLLGMIAAFYAQTLDPVKACLLGCYIHGLASRQWMKDKKDYLSMRPTDLIEKIPQTIFTLR